MTDMGQEEGREQGWRRPGGVLSALAVYARSHMWCTFAGVIVAAVLMMLLIVMFYMRAQYYGFLLETTYTTEQALLDSVNESLTTAMEDYIRIGSNICVDVDALTDTNLRGTIDEFAAGDRGAGAKQRMKNALRITGNFSNMIVGVAVADQDGILYQYDKYEVSNNTRIDLWDDQSEAAAIFGRMRELNSGKQIPRYLILSSPHEHPNVSGKGILSIAFPFRNGFSYQNIPYILLLTFQTSSLEEILGQLTAGHLDYVQGYIEDEEGRILLHTEGRALIGEDAQRYQEKRHLTDIAVPLGGYGWTLHAVIDEERILAKVDASYQPILLLYFVALLVVLGLLLWACSRTLQPVYLISESIAKVRRGSTSERIPILGTHEIWQLADSYNRMLDAISLANQEVEREHAQMIENMLMKQHAEREALESQINAHFICNTINAINYEAIDSGNYKVSVLLKKLSNILRYTFDQKHQNVYMRQEIVWIEQYLYLQRERLETVFDYEIEFDPDYDNWPCRKLMLQPFVENSISHGFEGMREGGRIRICGEGYREFLKITIGDNGCGMDEGRRTVIRQILENPRVAREKEVGIGISNVIARMKMYYGEAFQVAFETEEGKGTSFTFILPTPPPEGERKGEEAE